MLRSIHLPKFGGAPGGGGGTGAGGATDGKEVPASVLSGAENLLRGGGNSQQLQTFMAAQGYPKSGAWCGQFTASVVKASGGTRPKNAAIAANWLSYGQHVDAKDAKAGDIAVRLRSRFGGMSRPDQTGSHVGLVHDVDAAHRRFNLTGGNQGRPIVGHGINEYEFRRATETHRAALRDYFHSGRNPQSDGELLRRGMKAVDGGGPGTNHKLSIDFNNMPRGTKTAFSGDSGLFKEVTLNRGRPMAPASETS